MLNLVDLTPVEQRTLSDEAVDKLRAAIRSGTLAPGAKLVERDLADRLGMSRIPIREAIQRLIEEGLVRKEPHRSTYVYVPTRQEIEEICSLRVLLERFVAERVMERWQPEHEQTLRRIVKEMRAASERRDLQEVYECDYQFHLTMWKIADHSLLFEVISSLRSRISRFLYEANSTFYQLQVDAIAVHVGAHDDLIDVLTSGDPERAKDTITKHVLSGKQRILTYCNIE